MERQFKFSAPVLIKQLHFMTENIKPWKYTNYINYPVVETVPGNLCLCIILWEIQADYIKKKLITGSP